MRKSQADRKVLKLIKLWKKKTSRLEVLHLLRLITGNPVSYTHLSVLTYSSMLRASSGHAPCLLRKIRRNDLLYSYASLRPPIFLVFNNDSHASCSTLDHVCSCFKCCCVQVRHLNLCDFFCLCISQSLSLIHIWHCAKISIRTG